MVGDTPGGSREASGPKVTCASAGRAEMLDGADARRAGRLLGAKYPLLHSWLIPFGHRLMGVRTIHVELRPVEAASGAEAARGAEAA